MLSTNQPAKTLPTAPATNGAAAYQPAVTDSSWYVFFRYGNSHVRQKKNVKLLAKYCSINSHRLRERNRATADRVRNPTEEAPACWRAVRINCRSSSLTPECSAGSFRNQTNHPTAQTNPRSIRITKL